MYKQAQDLGGNIRRGEKGYHIVYWALVDNRNKTVTIKDAETGEEKNGILNTVCLNFMSFLILTGLKA